MLSKPMRGARPNRQHWSARGLVGEWLFNEGCGTKVFDSSGNGNNGTLVNIASPPTSTSGWKAGRSGGVLRFDGANDYVNCGNDVSLESSDFTWMGWGKATGSQTTTLRFINKGPRCAWPGYRYLGYVSTLGSVTFRADHWFLSSPLPQPYEWHHIAGTFKENDSLRLYLDGVLKTSNDTVTSLDDHNTYSLLIGGRSGCSWRPSYFKGFINGAFVYNRALSTEEIARHYMNEYAMYNLRLTLAQLGYFIKLGVITDPSILSLSVNRTMNSKTTDRTIKSLTPERAFNLGV